MVRICFSEKSLLIDAPIEQDKKDKEDKPQFSPGLFSNQEINSRIFEVVKDGKVKEFKLLLSGDPNLVHLCDSQMRSLAHKAASNNHAKILKLIVDYNGNVEALDEEGCSPLHLAVESEALDCISYLLQLQVDTRILNKDFQSPLHLAAQHGKVQSLKAMLKYDDILDVHQPGEHGRTPLHLACIHNRFDCVKILIEDLKASPRKACAHSLLPIHEAAKLGSFEALENLLYFGKKQGCPVFEMINSPNCEGKQALHFAVQSGDVKTVELCIECGAKISATQKDLSNAVHVACAQGSTQIVKLMLSLQREEKDVSLKSCDLERMTPLHYAAKFDHAELVEFLVEQNVHMNSLDKNKCTPLHLAASKNAWRTIKTLVRLGAKVQIQDINKCTVLHTIVNYNGDLNCILDKEIAGSFISILAMEAKNGNTPLHIATESGQLKSVSKLLELGSSIANKNVDGDTVLHTACRFGRSKIIQLIMEHPNFSTVLNESNNNGWTPVHLAVCEGHHRVLELLMKKGAFLRKDFKGRTPLHLAAKNGHLEVVRLILNTHSHLFDLPDKQGNTPLHSAALHNKSNVVKLLLSLNCQLTYNNDGYSAMDLALENKFIEAASELATHPKRADEIFELTEGMYECIMETLISKLPTVAKAVLDSGIRRTSPEKPDSPDYPVEYDFRRLKRPKGSQSKKRVKDHLSILNTIVSHQRVDLLSHELCLKYLEMKWNSYGKFFQYTNLIFYVFYLCLVTSLATNELTRDVSFFARWLWFKDPIEKNSFDNSTCSTLKFIDVKLFEGWDAFDAFDAYKDHGGSYSVEIFLLIATITAFNLVVEIVNLCRYGLKHFQNDDTWVWILMNISCSFATIFQIVPAFYPTKWDFISLNNPSLALAVFMGWFYLLMIMQRFDAVGLYVSMFLEILKTLLRVLVIFSILIVAFALAFFVLLSNGNHVAFSTIPLSIMRTFSMMLGDLDFMSTFLYPHHCEDMEKKNETNTRLYTTFSECTYPRRIPHPYPTFPIVCLYMIFMPIVMINLLIGLAVGDIELVRNNAKLKRLSMQVQSHSNMEKLIPNFILRRIDKSSVVEYPNAIKRNSIMESLGKFFKQKEKQQDEEDVVEIKSNDLMEAVLDSSTTIDQLTIDVENMKESLQLICTRLKIRSDVSAGEVASTEEVGPAIPGILQGLRNDRGKKIEWNDSADSNNI